MKPTDKSKEHTETLLIHISTHRGLFQWDQNKCMWTRSKDGTVCSHTFILFLMRKISVCQNTSVKFPCALLDYLCHLPGDLFIFLLRVFPFYSCFCVICTSVLSLSRGLSLSLSIYLHTHMHMHFLTCLRTSKLI